MAVAHAAHRSTWAQVDQFFALTQFMKDDLVRQGVPDGRILVRPTAAPDPGPPSPPGRHVLFVGRLEGVKGVDLLLEAWRSYIAADGCELRIVGDGPAASDLRVRAKGLKGVTFCGNVSSEQVAQQMETAAVIMLPSRWYEGLPRVMVEALAHGRPVIVSDVGGMASALPEGAGLAVSPTVESFRETLRLLEDRERLTTMGQQARAGYEQFFSEEGSLDLLLTGYQRAMHSAR